MKIMFLSDIHGIKTNLEKVKEKFQEFHCDKLVVLGDLYYLDPRSDKKKEYDINYVKDFLSSFKDKLICMRGNCDSDIDVLMSPFPMMNELSVISTDDIEMYLTHGHVYNERNWKKKNSILIFGHYHIPFILEKEENLFINPGSISLPKEDSPPTFMIYDAKQFTIYDIFDNIIVEKKCFQDN